MRSAWYQMFLYLCFTIILCIIAWIIVFNPEFFNSEISFYYPSYDFPPLFPHDLINYIDVFYVTILFIVLIPIFTWLMLIFHKRVLHFINKKKNEKRNNGDSLI